MRISGDDYKGIDLFNSHVMADEFAHFMRGSGYRVRTVAKNEIYLGVKRPVFPPSVRVYYNISGDEK